MTTVAIDKNGQIACDTLIVINNIASGHMGKVVVGKNEFIGFCGDDAGQAIRAATWLMCHEEDEDPPEFEFDEDNKGFELLHITKDHIMWHNDFNNPVPVTAPFAIGTGMDLAIAYMDAGHTAKEAVQYATTKDIFSGGEVLSYQVLR